MSAVKGRSKRPHVEGLRRILLQARVDEPSWCKANQAADAAGISVSAYIQSLIDRDETNRHGCPLWLEHRDQGQKEQPIKTTSLRDRVAQLHR